VHRPTSPTPSFNDHGQGGFGATDPKATYGEMLDGLVWNVTDAFRTHYVTRRVPRDQIVVAGAASDGRHCPAT
jgi:hypothetical protein